MNRKNKTINFSKVCRTCMTEKSELKPLFNACLADMLMSCVSSVKVEETDDLPSHVCIACFQQISRYYSFKTKVEKSDVFFRKYLLEQSQKKPDNIIAQAASNADIDIYKTEDPISDDEPKRPKKHKPTREAKTRANEFIESAMQEETTEYEEKYQMKSLQIFGDGPPPLVPLVPIAEIPDYPADNALVQQALAPISDETPPLIPIKPALVVDTSSTMDTSRAIRFACSLCKEEFGEPSALRNHMSELHAGASHLTCNICKKEFSDRKRLIGHLKGHMVVKHYACKLCGKRYPNPSTFRVHMRTHTGERPFKCQVCGKGFVRWAGVVGHMKSHNASKPYTCSECGKGFKIPSNLERHKVLHSGLMPFCCSYCGKTFSQADNLQLHIRTYHTHERPYLCSQCGKGFVSSTRLNRHMWVHTGYKPYACKSCSKAYSNSNDLKNHEKTHGGGPREADKPYACVSCDMRFFHPCRLAKHMKTHERPYGCQECLKTFSRQEVLHKHIISKHGVADQPLPMQHHHDQNIYTLTNY